MMSLDKRTIRSHLQRIRLTDFERIDELFVRQFAKFLKLWLAKRAVRMQRFERRLFQNDGFPPIKLAQNFRDAKVTGGRIGRLVQRQALTQRWLHFINTRSFGALAFGRQATERRLDRAGVDRVELLDVGNDLSHLRGKDAALFVGDFQMRELRDLFDVRFGNRHDGLTEAN